MTTCEQVTKAGRRCEYRAAYHAYVGTVPQQLTGPGGEDFGTEVWPAGRSTSCCVQHLARTVSTLHALPIRRYGARVEVSPCVD